MVILLRYFSVNFVSWEHGLANHILDPDVSSENFAFFLTLKKEHLYKLLVLGDTGTGKTSIIKRYIDSNYSMNSKSTVSINIKV